MTVAPTILVVAATARELAPATSWATLACGIGPVEAGVATAAAIAAARPAAILHVGIAGARRSAALLPPALVLGRESVYADLDPPSGASRVAWPPRVIVPPASFVAAVAAAAPGITIDAIGTSARVGGTSGCAVEAMEGYAVLRAAQRAGVPAIEVRAISNAIEETDRARWAFDAAFDAICGVTPRLVEAIARCVS